MITKPVKLYNGNALQEPVRNEEKEIELASYIPSPGLVRAVELAQVLRRPLLLKGEPGCGKTRLAEAVAYELHGDNYKDFYFKWDVKSTSKAQDGLYMIDHLRRLRDASLKDKKIDLELRENSPYLEFGQMGKAFIKTRTMTEAMSPPVILIDEVDKANIDFPNDLLQELDSMEFTIPEAGNIRIEANRKIRPLVFITSNDEKPLPAAFLRRCLFHFIEFPGYDDLFRIVQVNFPALEEKIIKEKLTTFQELRTKMEEEGFSNKTISTSELLDWMKIIDYYYQTTGEISKEEPPYYQSLFKDIDQLKKLLKKQPVENLTLNT